MDHSISLWLTVWWAGIDLTSRIEGVWTRPSRTHHLAILGKAKQPLCFKPPRQPCPIPFFSQTNAWKDGDMFKSCSETLFLIAVRAPTTSPVALVSNNCEAHRDRESDQVKFFALPSNCTSFYQLSDRGNLACLKRR